MEHRVIVVSEKCRALTAAMYGWSKHGGANFGLVQEKLGEEWTCQVCSKKQTLDQPYDFEFSPNEFIKICSTCHASKVAGDITELADLIAIVRGIEDIF